MSHYWSDSYDRSPGIAPCLNPILGGPLIQLILKKELGLGPESWAHGGNFKTTAKNNENPQYLTNLKNQKIPPD